jgi:hypothetical protein
MPPCRLQLPQRVCADDRLSFGTAMSSRPGEVCKALAEVGQRALLQGAHREAGEVGIGARREHQRVADPAHAVGAGQHAHFRLAIEQRQAQAVLDRDMARLRGVGEFGQLLQDPVAMAMHEGFDFGEGQPVRRADAQAALVDGHRQPRGAALQAVIDDPPADQEMARSRLGRR